MRNESSPCPECPIETLPPFELLDENKEAAALFLLCRTQWIVGQTLIGLDYRTVDMVAKKFNIEYDKDCFVKVQACEEEYLRIANERTQDAIDEAKNAADRGRRK